MRAPSLAVLMCASCLGDDPRPAPGSLLTNVAEAAVARDGFTTDDEWRISFDQILTSLSTSIYGVESNARSCSDYSSSFYDRVHDMTLTTESKQALHYGVGRCKFGFTTHPPSPRAILSEGVSEQDLLDMRLLPIPGLTFPPRASLVVRGQAERDNEVVKFDLRIPTTSFVTSCATESGEELTTVLLTEGQDHVRTLEFRPEELFRLTPSRDAPLLFGRFALADANDDGVVTMGELMDVDVGLGEVIADLRDELPPVAWEAFVSERTPGIFISLAEVIVLLSARVVAVQGAGECVVLPPAGLDALPFSGP